MQSLEGELQKMRNKLDKVMAKLYMPGQDQIIGGMNSSSQPHNVIRGAAQGFEMNHSLEGQDFGEGEDSPARYNQQPAASTLRDQEWAVELRKADQRSHEMRLRNDELQQTNGSLEEVVKALEAKVETRDNEILRLGGLYQGGQNNDRLTI